MYAQDLGEEAAADVAANPGALPLVTVFSKDFMDLPGSGVAASRIAVQDEGIDYRYTGLSLLTYSNGRWFLISGRYSDNYRPSIVILHKSERIRIEVAAPR